MIPGFRRNAGGFQQHPEPAKRRIDPDSKLRLHPEPLGAESVQLLDAVLGIAAVTAHVPLAGRACRTWDQVRLPYDCNDQVT